MSDLLSISDAFALYCECRLLYGANEMWKPLVRQRGLDPEPYEDTFTRLYTLRLRLTAP